MSHHTDENLQNAYTSGNCLIILTALDVLGITKQFKEREITKKRENPAKVKSYQ